ncbi:LysM peptidoglycan-binding domain-containing protein [Luteolibacter ambystomatis]|uniref:LysM peptidoglycan-binding domain-containing protein n=1 Tax=Luteolibacter ambystomatis TaxID=2824561 RepID=A0A975PG85_9BACT|nr:LysM peptidoglycan-binding domain-containing protein [Luteolibacter ambystomatis]QUE52061.1 LysM peptidoglycan-binding domain-containing protein [Luteolibacter ambystomatis]
MKATTLYATLALVLGAPAAFSKSELETLRERRLELDQRIRQLEQENSRLKDSKETAKPVAAEKTEKPAAKSGTYTVRAGDTLEKIARKTNCSTLALGKANGIKSETIIHPGQILKLPGSSATASNRPDNSKADAKEKESKAVAKKDTKDKEPKTEVAKQESKPAKEAPTLASNESKTISNPAPKPAAPQPKPEATAEASKTPAPTTGGGAKPPTIRSIIIQDETSYGSFASQHGTTAERLNDLNGLTLSTSTVLAKGSELYIPAQP